MTQPVRVQNTPHNRIITADVTAAFPGNVVAGNTCIVLCGVKNRSAAVVPTDTLGTIFAPADLDYTETAFGSWGLAVYRGVFGSSGANTITVPRNGADEINVICEELSSMAASPLDKNPTLTGSNWGTGSDTVTTTGTLAQADEIIYTLAIGRCNQTPPVGFATLPAPSGFNDLGTAYLGDGTPTNSPCHFAYKLVSATTAQAPVWAATETQVNDNPFAAMATVTYKGLVVVIGPPPPGGKIFVIP